MNILCVLILCSAVTLCSSKINTLENDNSRNEIKYEKRPAENLPAVEEESDSGFQMPPAAIIFGAVAGFVAVPLALPLMGFGAAGVTAGSLAAGVQSLIGNVAAGSGFAAMQSAGAVGAGLGTKAALSAGGAAVAAALQDEE